MTYSSEKLTEIEIPFSTVGDYYTLLKPRVMSLVLFTAFVGLLRAPGAHSVFEGFVILLSIALSSGGSGALNMAFEREVDARMSRTRLRPLPMGRIVFSEACAYGLILCVGGGIILGLTTNWFAAFLLWGTSFYYSIIYTLWLKPHTSQSIVIGGLAGAMPPLIAWSAHTGTMAFEPLFMVALIFFWTPPHFWALALLKKEDYACADIPMLPNVAGIFVTKRMIFIYTILVVLISFVPILCGWTGFLYGIIAGVLGGVFMMGSLKLYRENGIQSAKKLFGFSIIYLFGIFIGLLLDMYI